MKSPVPELRWDACRRIGFLPAEPNGIYDEAYFDHYVACEDTPIGRTLNRARVELVDRHVNPLELVVDVGIGAGSFIKARGKRPTHGFDVNPAGVRWLQERSLWRDPYTEPAPILTFWDSLEHIEDPAEILVRSGARTAFVSMPVYADRGAVLRSKHFKPGEHLWYFTAAGLEGWFRELGFELREWNQMESEAGREGIDTFVFSR